MTALAAFALIVTASPQGIIGPLKPNGPIVVPPRPIISTVNLVANAGFEASSMSPWQTGGYVGYFDESPDGLSAPLVGQSIYGYITNGNSHAGNKGFRMNAEYPNYVAAGAGHSATTYVQQSLSTPILGSAIAIASVWAVGDPFLGLEVEIEYTAGTPTAGSRQLDSLQWQKWDFRSLIDPKRTVKAIRFRSSGIPSGPTNYVIPTFIDDVNVSILIRL